MIHEFIKQFTDKKIDHILQIRKEFYLVNDELLDIKDKVPDDPSGIGLFLGAEVKKVFKPSLELLSIISKYSDNKVFVNDKAEWLFLCGRDLMAKSVVKSNVKKGIVFVQNNNDENLGYGKIIDKLDVGKINKKKDNSQNKIVIKNILDRGEYLRMER